ncbi:MAG: hypothetical protein IIZ83_00380 [Oscillospiraceae bacterium]|nr:hypothetical protein [Oscillospiraceae bacterium]
MLDKNNAYFKKEYYDICTGDKSYTEGHRKAWIAWDNSLHDGLDEIEMNDFLWEREVVGFCEALRAAGYTSFTYTNQSTAVMENIHAFAAAGCTMVGLATITKTNIWGETKNSLGIRFTL